MLLTSRRTLVQALIVSLLIHAAILLRVVSLLPVRLNTPSTTISAVVRLDNRGEPPKPAREPIAKPLAESVKPPSPVARKVVTQQIVVPESPSSVAPTAPPAQPEVRDASAHAPVPTEAATGGGVPAAVVAKPESARDGVSAVDLSQYSISLGKSLRRFKRYPALASERGWEGTAEITLTFNALLPIPEVVLFHSSGQAVLDEQALAMMTQAVRVTSLPESLKGRDFRVTKSVKFSLDDD
jgi:protein TonB